MVEEQPHRVERERIGSRFGNIHSPKSVHALATEVKFFTRGDQRFAAGRGIDDFGNERRACEKMLKIVQYQQ